MSVGFRSPCRHVLPSLRGVAGDTTWEAPPHYTLHTAPGLPVQVYGPRLTAGAAPAFGVGLFKCSMHK